MWFNSTPDNFGGSLGTQPLELDQFEEKEEEEEEVVLGNMKEISKSQSGKKGSVY